MGGGQIYNIMSPTPENRQSIVEFHLRRDLPFRAEKIELMDNGSIVATNGRETTIIKADGTYYGPERNGFKNGTKQYDDERVCAARTWLKRPTLFSQLFTSDSKIREEFLQCVASQRAVAEKDKTSSHQPARVGDVTQPANNQPKISQGGKVRLSDGMVEIRFFVNDWTHTRFIPLPKGSKPPPEKWTPATISVEGSYVHVSFKHKDGDCSYSFPISEIPTNLE
jgi:hypothetical protein